MGSTELEKQTESPVGDVAAWIRGGFGLPEQDLRSFSPLTLAYIGDAIYDLVIRTMLVEKGNAPVNTLHRKASGMVKAEAQKDALRRMEEQLTEEEQSVFRRGRNAKSYTSAKNASIADYRIATGLEALMGYLYLSGQLERLLYLIKLGLGETEHETNSMK